MFGIQGKMLAVMLVGGGVVYGVSELDKSMNYVETTGVVTSAKVECFIKTGKRSVVVKNSDELAYMNCTIAPMVAKRFGHEKSAIKKRAKIEYKFNSPVDGKSYTGNFIEKYNVAKYKHGAKFKVFAHKSSAEKSQL